MQHWECKKQEEALWGLPEQKSAWGVSRTVAQASDRAAKLLHGSKSRANVPSGTTWLSRVSSFSFFSDKPERLGHLAIPVSINIAEL